MASAAHQNPQLSPIVVAGGRPPSPAAGARQARPEDCLDWHGGTWEQLKSASSVGEADAQVSATPLLLGHLEAASVLGLGLETLYEWFCFYAVQH